jgi:hypothetical protein
MAAQLKIFLFSSGWEVRYRSVAFDLVRAAEQAVPQPKPPVEEVPTADGIEMVPNPDHPDHIKALVAYQQELTRVRARLYLTRGLDALNEEEQEAVQQLRADMAAIGVAAQLPADDKEVFVNYVCPGYPGEVRDFLNAVVGLSQPTPQEVAAQRASFQHSL